MLKLELHERRAVIKAATPNRELHGEDPKPYCALRLGVVLLPDDLAMFHPQLRGLLFKKDDRPEADLAAQGSDATMLRFPQVNYPLKWNDELVGADVVVHYGTSEKSHLNLSGCVINKAEIEPMEGGTVIMSCTVICHPDEKQMGRLGMMVGTEIPISVTPPSEEGQQTELKAAA